jgi:hypothetical protein
MQNTTNTPLPRAEIANRLRALSAEMITLGTEMDYYGGFDDSMGDHGREMVCAGVITHEWAEEIDPHEVGTGEATS